MLGLKYRLQKLFVPFIASSLAAVCACGRPPEKISGKTTLVPIARFVDEAATPHWAALRSLVYEPWRRLGGSRPLRTKDLATATINDDTRYVLSAPPAAVDTISIADLRLEAGRRSLEFPLPESFSRSSLAVVRTVVRAGVHWSKPQLLGVFSVTKGQDGGLIVPFSLPAAAIEAGATHLYVEVFGTGEHLAAYETRPSAVSKDARLRFSTGLLSG
ncbi:MAG TPA: hypothetical protein VFO62_02420, partial [Candidatus Binatia bacterium]|nr:hypothetical protein [Candidatus Binatia bacterium]